MFLPEVTVIAGLLATLFQLFLCIFFPFLTFTSISFLQADVVLINTGNKRDSAVFFFHALVNIFLFTIDEVCQ